MKTSSRRITENQKVNDLSSYWLPSALRICVLIGLPDFICDQTHWCKDTESLSIMNFFSFWLFAFSCGVSITGGIIVWIHVELIISEATLNSNCQENNTIGGKCTCEILHYATHLGSGHFLKEKIDVQLKVDLKQVIWISLCEAFPRVYCSVQI